MLKEYNIKKVTPVYSMIICHAETILDEILFHFYTEFLSQCDIGDILYLYENDTCIQATLLVVPYKESDYIIHCI